MPIQNWLLDDAQLTLDTPQGVPAQLRDSFRRLESLGLLDDAMLLRIIADTISVDPLSLCATVQQGYVDETPGLNTEGAEFLGAVMTLPVMTTDGSATCGNLAIALTTNDINLIQQRHDIENSSTDLVEITTQPLRGVVLFEIINHPEAAVRINRLRRIFSALAYTVQTAEGVIDPVKIAEEAIDT